MHIEFLQQVPNHGYRWVTGQTGAQGEIASKLEPVDPAQFSQYRCTDRHPELFLWFSELPMDKDSIRTFANEHGSIYEGSLYMGWRQDIEAMRAGVKLWIDKDVKRSANLIILFDKHVPSSAVGTRRDPSNLLDLQIITRPGNLIGAMWWQFVLAAQSGQAFGRCAVCGRWMVLRDGRATREMRGKKYCRARCSSDAWRRRKTAANAAK